MKAQSMSRTHLMGAAALFSGFAPERKEVDGLGPEVKAAVDELSKTIHDFRQKNDERLKQIETRREDVVTKEEVERINKSIDDAIAAVKKRQDEVEAKANRFALLGGGDDAATEFKNARLFGEMIGQKEYGVENLAEYKGDLAHYLRRNEVKAVTLQVGSDPAGGYLVTPDTSGRMVKKIYESTPMRQLCNVVTIGSDSLEGPIDNGEMDAAWVGEVQTRSQTDAPQLGMWKIPVNELYAYPKVTLKLLEDSKIDIEAWLGDKAIGKFARKENSAFVGGDGALKPRGLFTYDVAATADDARPWGTFQFIASGAAGAFAASNPADKLLDLIYEVKAAYRQQAKFLAARRTLGAMRKLKDGQGNYLYGLRMQDGALVETVFGYGVTDGEDVPAFSTANNLGLAFGDFAEAYTIVDRIGFSVIRDNITQPGFVKYNMRKRVGGGAVNFEAVKFMKFA